MTPQRTQLQLAIVELDLKLGEMHDEFLYRMEYRERGYPRQTSWVARDQIVTLRTTIRKIDPNATVRMRAVRVVDVVTVDLHTRVRETPASDN